MPASLDDWLITPSISQTFSLALPGYTDMSMWQACNRLLNLLPSASALNLHSESESEVTQPCLTLRDPTDCSLPGFSIHGIFQARILEWVAISFSRGSSRPRSPAMQEDSLTSEPPASMWNEHNCTVIWTVFGIAFLWDWNENWPFPILWSLLSFPNILSAAL